MIRIPKPGLGTRLRRLLAQLDGELVELYKSEGHQFRPRFYPVFELLLASEKASVSEVASHLEVSQPAATQTLAEMKRLGFVTYEQGADRRERYAKLTPHALATARLLEPLWNAVGAAARQLDEELSHPLSDTLDEAIAALDDRSFRERVSDHLPSKRAST